MNRIKAASFHLVLSCIAFAAIVIIMRNLWFPAHHFSSSGGWQGLKIAATVDLILGPLLTFIVFNTSKSKKTIISDLIVIAIIQLIALAWGVATIYQQRPVALVFWEDSFFVVPAIAFKNQQVHDEFLAIFGDKQPVMIYAEKPNNSNQLKAIAERTARNNIPPYQQIDLYRPLQPNFNRIKSRQVDIENIISNNLEMKTDLFEILDKTKSKIDDFVYIPLLSKYGNIILMFNLKGEWINQIIVPLRDHCQSECE